MAGETIKSRAICLAVRPWSRTSHVTTWLTPAGCVTTLVKGAVRPKSAFLGQYDLNYTCDILYYARAKGDVHALRECSPAERHDALRGNFRALALADWFIRLALDLVPTGPEAAAWFELMEKSLEGLEGLGGLDGLDSTPPAANCPQPSILCPPSAIHYLRHLLSFELEALRLAGLAPEFTGKGEDLRLRGERNIPVSADVMRCLEAPRAEKNIKILVDAARVIGVFYAFHLDCAPDVRRTVLRMISH